MHLFGNQEKSLVMLKCEKFVKMQRNVMLTKNMSAEDAMREVEKQFQKDGDPLTRLVS